MRELDAALGVPILDPRSACCGARILRQRTLQGLPKGLGVIVQGLRLEKDGTVTPLDQAGKGLATWPLRFNRFVCTECGRIVADSTRGFADYLRTGRPTGGELAAE